MICETCSGRRIIQGFGGVRKDCTACGGSGRVADKPVVIANEHIDKRSKEYRELKKQREV